MKHYTKEADFQAHVVKRLEEEFPGCVIMVNDGNYRQGFPDITMLDVYFHANFECKLTADAPHQPNQDWWIERLNKLCFARFIFPENEEDVFHELHQAFRS